MRRICGSEYVNHKVAKLLSKLHVEFTRSRPRHNNDNSLAETKNGGVVRKLFACEHIPQPHAAAFNAFCPDVLNPFLNFHRPCLFASDKPDPSKSGRIKRICRPKDVMTPLDKLASLPDAHAFLRQYITLDSLQQQAKQQTDVQAAQAPQLARAALFKTARKRTG